MAFLLDGWFKTSEDDINELPPDLRVIYVNPWKVFGLFPETPPWELRDAFRQRCLQMTPEFASLQVPGKHSTQNFRQVLFAYRLCTGELTGPAGKLSQALGTSPLLQNTNPWDILSTLRPLKAKGIRVAPSARASKMLAIQLKDVLTIFGSEGFSGLPHVAFELEVSYCMRTHRVQKSVGEFELLHEKLASELIVLPNFPEGGGLGLLFGGKQEFGRDLCNYVQRVHTLLAQRGVFSPRVMEFLKVDFGRVHIEEEGRVVSENLDTRTLMQDTCWQAVEEGWLVRWRKFILGRGARRYHAPGEMDNRPLLLASRKPRKSAGESSHRVLQQGVVSEGLVLGEDYRLVNYNVWKYWLMVYGGGPSIGRVSKDIYACSATAYPTAVVKVQAAMRGFLGRKRAWREYFSRLAKEHAGAKEILYQRKLQDTQEAALAHIEAARRKREKGRVARAVFFTQVEWRRKKGYVFQADRLQTQQYIQDIFERADNTISEPPKNKPRVVREVKSIVNIGGAEVILQETYEPISGSLSQVFLMMALHAPNHLDISLSMVGVWCRGCQDFEEIDVRFDEDSGLNIGFRRRGGHVRGGRGQDTAGHVVGGGSDGGGGGEQTVVYEAPAEHPRVKTGSVLLAINKMPVKNMSHRSTMAQIRQASWPLVLRFRLPLEEDDVFDLSEIAIMSEKLGKDIAVEQLKRKLLRGQLLHRFPTGKCHVGSRPYETRLSIDEHNLYYEGKNRLSLQEESVRSIMLYNLKFVRKGKTTSTLNRAAHQYSDDVCFSIAAESKVLHFAMIPTPDGMDDKRCEMMVEGLKAMIKEVQGSQVYVDKDGAVKRRVRPKNMLTTVQGRERQHHSHQHMKTFAG